MHLSLPLRRFRGRASTVSGIAWGTLVAAALFGGGAGLAQVADVAGPTAVLSLPGGTILGRLVESPPAADGASPTSRALGRQREGLYRTSPMVKRSAREERW